MLEEATKVLGAKTYSAAVNQALEEIVNIRKIQNLQQFFGKDLWDGDLAEMREDKPEAASDRKAQSASASGR
jgi:hypothetical protein